MIANVSAMYGIDLQLWLTFVVATFLICISPGPNMLKVMISSATHGFRASMYVMVGCFIAVFVMIVASVAGVGALLLAFPEVFNALRYLGAAYLVYLGIQAWRTPVFEQSGVETPVMNTPTPYKLFRGGLLVGASNVKALLFAAAFFPQFIDPALPTLPQFLILITTFSILEISCYMLYAMGGSTLAAYMKRMAIRKAFNRFTGGLFGMYGALLAAKA